MAYVIGDFSFETEEDAREAQKEVQAISYIMKQIIQTRIQKRHKPRKCLYFLGFLYVRDF